MMSAREISGMIFETDVTTPSWLAPLLGIDPAPRMRDFAHAALFPPLVIQSLSCVWLFAAPWTAARQASLSFTISQSLLKLVH